MKTVRKSVVLIHKGLCQRTVRGGFTINSSDNKINDMAQRRLEIFEGKILEVYIKVVKPNGR